MTTNQSLSLFELNREIKSCLTNNFSKSLLITAEISEIRENSKSGHCYLELIEKNRQGDEIIARAKANIWAYAYRMIKPYFQSTTGQSLQPGIKILFKATVEYSEVWGLSLNIQDVDPTYTLGDIAKRRMDIIKRLHAEGVLEMNKELEMSVTPQRIAIISSSTAAGYGDFINQLTHNNKGFKFYIHLFEAQMQGAQATESIIGALEKIYQYEHLFDLVIIIRGGGAAADLYCFDNYDLAFNIAQFSLPILTGIGHDRDETVADLVAHQALKTPTAVAEYLIDAMNETENYLNELSAQFQFQAKEILKKHQKQVENLEQQFPNVVKNYIRIQKTGIQNISKQLHASTLRYVSKHNQQLSFKASEVKRVVKTRVKREGERIEILNNKLKVSSLQSIKNNKTKISFLEKNIQLLDPKNLLQKGYSITYINKKAVKSSSQIQIGDTIETHLADGVLSSKVTEKKNLKLDKQIMAKTKPTFKEAIAEVEEILEKIESDELDIDELSTKVAQVSALLKSCKEKLHKTEQEVEKVLNDIE